MLPPKSDKYLEAQASIVPPSNKCPTCGKRYKRFFPRGASSNKLSNYPELKKLLKKLINKTSRSEEEENLLYELLLIDSRL